MLGETCNPRGKAAASGAGVALALLFFAAAPLAAQQPPAAHLELVLEFHSERTGPPQRGERPAFAPTMHFQWQPRTVIYDGPPPVVLTQTPPAPQRQRVADVWWWTSTGIHWAALLADAKTTVDVGRRCPTLCPERNPFLPDFPSSKQVWTYVAIEGSAVTVGSYFLQRWVVRDGQSAGARLAGYLAMPGALTAAHVVAATGNSRLPAEK